MENEASFWFLFSVVAEELVFTSYKTSELGFFVCAVVVSKPEFNGEAREINEDTIE